MADLNIRYGLSSELFIDGQVNPKLIIEANCWYLCTDTAELFLGTYEECDSCANCTHCANCTNCTNCDNCSDRKLILKKINSTKLDQVAACIVKLEIIDGNLIATYSDDTVVDLGKTVDYIPTKVSEFVNDAGYITAADIPATDLSSYAKKSDIPDVSKFITSIPDEYITESELADLKYATEQYVIDAIANKVPVSDLAKKEEVEEVKTKLEAEVLPTIKETILPTVQELAEKAATQEWVQEQGYLTEHQDLSEYAKKSELPVVDGLASEEFVIKKIAEAKLADQEVDLSAYYTKSETEAAINAAIGAIDIPEVPTKVSELENDAGYITAEDIPGTDLSNYYNKAETENLIAEAVESIEHPTVNLDGYATEEWVNEQGYLTEHQDLSEYAKKTELFSKSYKDLVDTPEIPSIDGLASEEYVDNAIANIDIPEVDLTNVYTKNETDSVIASAISNIKHPTPDLTAYALKSDLEIKADDIPFATNRYVSNAIGNFVAGESVRGLTIAEILAKLLGLSDVPQGVVDDIIINKYGLYQFDDSIEIEKLEFTLTEFNTAEEYAGAPDKTTFYQYTYTNDEGKKVTESGYQHYTLAQDFIWYMVMLPSSLVIGENVKVQAWADEPRNMWVDTITTLESDLDVIAANFAEVGLELPEIPEGYTMWVDFSNTNPGNIVRYIIIE